MRDKSQKFTCNLIFRYNFLDWKKSVAENLENNKIIKMIKNWYCAYISKST